MGDTALRYPGVQPFRDDGLARRTFFGRKAAAVALTDQILASRLVVVYAKSGVGKTSLLNAGVAPRLRGDPDVESAPSEDRVTQGCVPLFVRVNDVEHDLLASVLDSIRAEALRQRVEYVPGDRTSLWSFFKTVQFWRGDLLLTPVLVLDQFEELFILQSEEARDQFLSELSYVIRGVPPASALRDPSKSGTPPLIHVVLSLREDFLGLLEEASDRIPQILDHRFRLSPLDRDKAADAITGPAEIEDPNLATRPFQLKPEVVPAILDYLTKSAVRWRRTTGRYVEPFQLQLICQRIERTVAARQARGAQQGPAKQVQYSLEDLGGEAAMADTLEDFYEDAINSLPRASLKSAARRLCEEYLISPEGRRLSLDERQVQMQLKLPKEALRHLVDCRLLRTDRRAECTYYELSHDALVQPVLASRRTQALSFGWAKVALGTIFSLFSFGLIAALTALITEEREWGRGSTLLFYLGFVLPGLAFIGYLGIRLVRAGVHAQRRYHLSPEEVLSPGKSRLPIWMDNSLGWMALVSGTAIVGSYVVVLVLALIINGTVSTIPGTELSGWTHKLPTWFFMHALEMRHAPLAEIVWLAFEFGTIISFGWILLRFAARRLLLYSFRPRYKFTPVAALPATLSALLKLVWGIVTMTFASVWVLVLRQCITVWQGQFPNWFPADLIGAITNPREQTRGYLFTVGGKLP